MVIPFLFTLFVVSHILQSMNRWLSRITSCTTFVILDIQKKNILNITYKISCCSSKTWWLNSFLNSVKPNPNFMRNSNIVYPKQRAPCRKLHISWSTENKMPYAIFKATVSWPAMISISSSNELITKENYIGNSCSATWSHYLNINTINVTVASFSYISCEVSTLPYRLFWHLDFHLCHSISEKY